MFKERVPYGKTFDLAAALEIGVRTGIGCVLKATFR